VSQESLETSFSFSGYDRLMPWRIRDILLVSSLYDSFILEQDGRLSELLLTEYAQLNLSSAPLVTRVSSGEEALAVLAERRFDLVITMTHLGDMEVREFGRKAKEILPGVPVVLLVYNTRELAFLREVGLKPDIDRVFAWSGDARILLAIIKSVEDRANAAHDTRAGMVRCLLLIENSVNFYSSYLPLIYTELMHQTQALMADGIDLMDKLLRMRARPKILLAEDYEEAEALYREYKDAMLGVITDAQYRRGGKTDKRAGVRFIEMVKAEDPDLPTLLQSADAEREKEAAALGTEFLNKTSPTLLADLRAFMKARLGFGDFVFMLPGGAVVGRAADRTGMARLLRAVPAESLRYHASRNHFSNWFMARTEFELALRIRPIKVTEFGDDMEALRRYLAETLDEYREAQQRGRVADFSARQFDRSSNFVRIGTGSLGGKGRGLAFINALISRSDLGRKYPDTRIFVPQSAVLGTDCFDEFVQANDLLGLALDDRDDEAISEAFLAAALPGQVVEALRVFLAEVRVPLAVRSSSLLEDSQHQPFAGVYTSHMLPNNHPDEAVRLDRLCRAVKLVYASTYYRSAKAYLQATPNRIEEEKMAVIIQQMVGRRREQVIYPGIAGVAQSYNFYPVHRLACEDGAVSAVLGLGKAVMEGERSLWFSPRHPRLLPQFGTTDDWLKHAQREFWALSLEDPAIGASPDGNAGLVRLDLAAAESHGTLATVGSVYSPDNDAVYDGISRPGVRLVSLAGVLKGGAFRLADILRDILALGERGMAAPVELEFAANPKAEDGQPPEFAVLQVRPLVVGREEIDLDARLGDRERVVIYSEQVMGNGAVEGIRDIVLVRRDAFDRGATPEVALEIRKMNERLRRAGRPYLLVGPGRWGTRDRWLGIPVAWADISWARVIVETDMADIRVEPSQGSHFFHNLTSFEVGYFTTHEANGAAAVDWSWLESLPATADTRYLRHARLDVPLEICLDGRTGRGAVLRPA